MASKDGKGRTIFDIITGNNQKDLTPLELQYHNPLKAKVGNTVSFDHEPDIKDINFVIEKISVYETKIGNRKFYHTDYHLRGIALEMDKPLRYRLRLSPDEDENNAIGCKLLLLNLYDEMEWDQSFFEDTLGDPSGEFWVKKDDSGQPLEEPRIYWRINDVVDSYHARQTILSDKDGDGTVEESELERHNIEYWDYSRMTKNAEDQDYLETLVVEMNDKTRYFTFLRGIELQAFQVTVI